MRPFRRSWKPLPRQDFPDLYTACVVQCGLTPADIRPEKGGTAPLWMIHDMQKAVDVIAWAKANGKRVGVFGDYDSDGLNATALLARALMRAGIDVFPHIPDRSDGYGLNPAAITLLHDHGCDVVITVDNGTGAIDVVEAAHGLGMKVIITDHHPVPMERCARPDALLNPTLEASEYPFRELCGSGVAYALALCLADAGVIPAASDLAPFAAVGTIADVVSLRGPNRGIVTAGLLAMKRFAGFSALMNVCWLNEVTAKDVGWDIAPRLNAAGRIDTALKSLELLMTDDPQVAARMAKELNTINVRRRKLSKEFTTSAERMLSDDINHPESDYSVLVASEEWIHGVVGLVAGRLAEGYKRPAYVAAIEPEVDERGIRTGRTLAKGSARSGAFHADGNKVSCAAIMEAARWVADETGRRRDMLISGGGHAAACGFVLLAQDLPAFAARLEAAAKQVMIDGVRTKELVNVGWGLPTNDDVVALATLEPTGEGFPAPVISSMGVQVDKVFDTFMGGAAATLMLKEKTKTGVVKRRAKTFARAEELTPGTVLDVAYKVEKGTLTIEEFDTIF